MSQISSLLLEDGTSIIIFGGYTRSGHRSKDVYKFIPKKGIYEE